MSPQTVLPAKRIEPCKRLEIPPAGEREMGKSRENARESAEDAAIALISYSIQRRNTRKKSFSCEDLTFCTEGL
jgi:hypothetical protein